MTEKKRDAPIPYRPANGCRAAVTACIKGSGLPASVFITQAILAHSSRQAAGIGESPAIVKVGAKVADVADLLRAATPDLPGEADCIARCERELIEIRTLLLHALGRRP